MNKNKGFTIIELLVVIAIIAVLAAIVLVNVTSSIGKGKDAAVKGNLSGLRTSATIIYDSTSSFATVCTAGTDSKKAYDAAVSASGKTGNNNCNAAAGTYVACVEEVASSGNGWCVDSTGTAKEITATGCTNAITACP